MRPSLLRACLSLVLASLASGGCMSIHQEARTGKVQVETDPAGAQLTKTDAKGKQSAGVSPAAVEYAYDVEVREWNHWGCWPWAVLGWGATAFGGYTLVDAIQTNSEQFGDYLKGGVVLGLGIGLAASMTAVCAAEPSKQGEGEHILTKEPVRISAAAEGRVEQEMILDLKKPPEALRLVLPAALAARTAAAPVVAAAPILAPSWTAAPGGGKRLAVLEFRGSLDPATLATLADEARSVALGATRGRGYAVMTRESMASMLKDMGRPAVCDEGECEVETARNIGADLVLTGEIAQIAGTYVVTLKLHETAKGTLLAAGRAQGKDGLELLGALRPAAEGLFK